MLSTISTFIIIIFVINQQYIFASKFSIISSILIVILKILSVNLRNILIAKKGKFSFEDSVLSIECLKDNVFVLEVVFFFICIFTLFNSITYLSAEGEKTSPIDLEPKPKDSKRVLGLNRNMLMLSGLVIVGAIAYKFYATKK